MRINRLIEITMILLNKKTVTARELAGRFQVSSRTIYRDVDDLSAAGVPVYMKQGTGGGISLLPDYSLDRTFLSTEDRDSLVMVIQTLQVTKMPGIDTALQKLGILFSGSDTRQWAQVELTPWGSDPNEGTKFTVLKEVILKRLAVSFDYLNSAGESTQREVEPLKLMYKGHAWYLYGWCRLKADYRVFRLSRIKSLLKTDESFPARKGQDMVSLESGEAEPQLVTLKLKFHPSAAYRVYDDFAEKYITKNQDGTNEVTVTFPEDEWVYGYILSFGSGVEVLTPKHVRDIVRARLQDTLAIYHV